MMPTSRLVVALVLACAYACIVVSGLPVSMQRDMSSVRSVDSHEEVVALQLSEATKLVDAAVKAGQPKPQIIPLTANIRTQHEEEDYFALIDEHHDNLEQGRHTRDTTHTYTPEVQKAD